jgi:hypothetical protein
MPFQKDYTDQAKVVKYLLTAGKELQKLTKDVAADDALQLKLIKQKQTEVNKLQKIYKDNAKTIKASLENFEDIDDTLISIGNTYKKNTKALDIQQKTLEAAKLVTSAISMELVKGVAKTKKTQEQIVAAVNGYKTMHVSIANINKEYEKGRISDARRVEMIKEQSEAFQDVAKSIDMSNVTSDELKGVINGMTKEAHSFAGAMEKSEIGTERLDQIFESFEGIPALGEVNKLLKTNIKDTVAFKAAVFALGAALGAAAMDYFGAPIMAAIQARKESEQEEIDTLRDVAKIKKDAEFIPRKISQEKLEAEVSGEAAIAKARHESEFTSQRAALAFSDTMAKGAVQFQAAAKTALFGKSIGSIGYGAAQMQLAGIGADKIASAMEAASAATGKMPTASAAADMAIMAERTGTSADDIANINESFQRLDKVSAGVAMNLQEGMRNMADQAGIGLGKLMKEVAEASKDALGYQIKSGPALAKAVAYTQSMGVNFGDVAKAGKSMVMNYKDSIKAEMQLSSMLGEQVDLAEARAKFAAGDTEGGLASIKSQGLDPADMDMFQQQALQDALGGLDLNSISKISQNTGKQTTLGAADAKKGNKGFLGAKQKAQQTLEAQEASISAKTAILSAELEKKIEMSYLDSKGHKKQLEGEAEAAAQARELASAMQQAWLQTDEYKKSLSDTAKLNFADKLKEGVVKGLSAIAGGLVMSKIMGGGGGGMMGMMGGMFKGKGGGEGGGEGGIGGAVKGGGGIGKKGGGGIGKNIGDLGGGLGKLIKSVGEGAGKAIEGLLTGIAKGLAAFGTNAADIALGGTAIAAVIVQIGAGLAGASWLMGKALPTLSEGMQGFNKIDGGNLTKIGVGMLAMGTGLAALGVGSVINAIGGWLGKKMGGGGLEEVVAKMRVFGNEHLNTANIKNNAEAVIAYSKAMAASGLGSAVNGLGNLVGGIANAVTKFFTGRKELPLDEMKAFGAVPIANAETIKANAEVFTAFATAMGSYKGSSGTFGGVLADAAAKFFKLEPPIEKMKAFGKELFVKDPAILKANAEAFTIFGNAMASFKGMNGGLMATLSDGLAKFFELEPPMEQMQRFAAMNGIDVAKTKNNAEAFTAFGTAMASYSGTGTGFWSSLGKGISDFFGGGDGDLIAKFREFAALDANGVTAISTAIGSFNSNLSNFKMETAEEVGKGMVSVATATTDNLTSDKVDAINAFAISIGFLNSQLQTLGSVAPLMETTSVAFMNLASALQSLAAVNTKAINDIPWIRMTAFAGAGGRITLAQSANNSFNIAQDSAKNIATLATDTKANLQVSKNLQALIAVLANENTAGTQLIIDGKAVADMLTRRDDNRKGTKTT